MSGFEENEVSKNANGGTEITKRGLAKLLPAELLEEFQIICSRVRELDEKKIRIYWAHDLPLDPEVSHLKEQSSRNKFHKIIWNSNFQLNEAVNQLGYPRDEKTEIIETPVESIPYIPKSKDSINLIYFSMPNRGLDILVPVVEELAKKHTNIHLDVYSSWKIYGWDKKDEECEPFYDKIRQHPNMSYHGFADRETLIKAIQKAHILAYPCTYVETACVPAGAKIITKNGVKNIEDISVGDYVITHIGNFKRVTETFSRPYKGKLYGVKGVGSGKFTYFTPEHEIFAGFMHKRNDAKQQKTYTRKIYKEDWVRADNLKQAHHCLLRSKIVFGNRKEINIIDYIKDESYKVDEHGHINKTKYVGLNKPVVNVQQLSREFGFIVGLFAGDGCASNCGNQLYFSHNARETDNVNAVVNFFGESNITIREISKNELKTTYSSKIWHDFFNNAVGVGRNKRIPDFIWEAPREVQESFVAGYYAADGKKSSGRDRVIDTVSSHLAYGLCQMLSNLGVFAGVHYHEKLDFYKITWTENPINKYFCENDFYFGAKITDADVMPYDGYVYNFEVEEDHSYFVENILVHNCRVLIESMSGGLMCVHPNLGALADTSGMLTLNYQYQPNKEKHAAYFYKYLDYAINIVLKDETQGYLSQFVKSYADMRFNAEGVGKRWEVLLGALLEQYPTEELRKLESQIFYYRT